MLTPEDASHYNYAPLSFFEIDFCHPIEIENENFAENDESAEEMDLKKK